MADDEPRALGMLSHLLGALTLFVGPLLMWLVVKRRSEFVAANARSALNFSITETLVLFALFVLAIVMAIVLPDLMIVAGILFLLLFLVIAVARVMYIIGALKALGGDEYEYIWSLSLFR